MTVSLSVSGGGSLIPPGGTATAVFAETYPSAAAAVAALDGLEFVSNGTFAGAAALTFIGVRHD